MDETARIPRHVAIIMDGNGRWAKARRLPRHAGHRAGVDAVRAAVEHALLYKIEILTLFAFSSENWRRPDKEVGLLMDLFMTALQREVKKLNRNDVRLSIIGDRSAFPDKLQEQIASGEALTAHNSTLHLQIAANYGGRWDITRAARRVAAKVNNGGLKVEEITEEVIDSELSFAGLPDPDLFIRTGGERRLSNFLLWQLAYAELYFTDLFWPDFDAVEFDKAITFYAGRQRRFGQISEQVSGQNSPEIVTPEVD